MCSKVIVSDHFLLVQTCLNQVHFEFLENNCFDQISAEQRKVEFSLKKPYHFSKKHSQKSGKNSKIPNPADL
jgi:hypothetical protein